MSNQQQLKELAIGFEPPRETQGLRAKFHSRQSLANLWCRWICTRKRMFHDAQQILLASVDEPQRSTVVKRLNDSLLQAVRTMDEATESPEDWHKVYLSVKEMGGRLFARLSPDTQRRLLPALVMMDLEEVDLLELAKSNDEAILRLVAWHPRRTAAILQMLAERSESYVIPLQASFLDDPIADARILRSLVTKVDNALVSRILNDPRTDVDTLEKATSRQDLTVEQQRCIAKHPKVGAGALAALSANSQPVVVDLILDSPATDALALQRLSQRRDLSIEQQRKIMRHVCCGASTIATLAGRVSPLLLEELLAHYRLDEAAAQLVAQRTDIPEPLQRQMLDRWRGSTLVMTNLARSMSLELVGSLIADHGTSPEILESIACRNDLSSTHHEGLILHPNINRQALDLLKPHMDPGLLRQLRAQLARYDENMRGQLEERIGRLQYSDYSDYSDYSGYTYSGYTDSDIPDHDTAVDSYGHR